MLVRQSSTWTFGRRSIGGCTVAVDEIQPLELQLQRVKRDQKPTVNPTSYNFVSRMRCDRVVLHIFTMQINLELAQFLSTVQQLAFTFGVNYNTMDLVTYKVRHTALYSIPAFHMHFLH